MKKAIFTTTLALLICIPNVFAANWVQYDEKEYLDTESINRESYSKYINTYSVWTKTLNDGSEDFKNLENTFKKKIWYIMDKQTFDCDKRTIRHDDMVFYDLQKNVIYMFQPYQTSSVIPESNGEALYNYVCLPRMNNTPQTDSVYNYDLPQNNNVHFKVKSRK